MKKNIVIIVAIIIAAVAFRFMSIKFGEFQRNKINKANAIPSVQVDEIKEHEISKSIEIAGRIESSDKVDIVARVDGYLQKKLVISQILLNILLQNSLIMLTL